MEDDKNYKETKDIIILMKDIFAYSEIIKKARSFFGDVHGFIEVPAQSRLSILAACENPHSIVKFNFGGKDYPLPQTGQMWLEEELLIHPDVPGVFCFTTSYRDEKEEDMVDGRHDKIFPMIEFESKGGLNKLISLEGGFLEHFGFRNGKELLYEDACKRYGVNIIGDEEERKIGGDYGNVTYLKKFPMRTHPFWNMKHAGEGIFNKVDVLIHGMETIGSAERSINVEEMRNNFYTISDGAYAGKLFSDFGKKRVEVELEKYLSLKMFERFGGGIGVTRLARAMYLEGLLDKREAA